MLQGSWLQLHGTGLGHQISPGLYLYQPTHIWLWPPLRLFPLQHPCAIVPLKIERKLRSSGSACGKAVGQMASDNSTMLNSTMHPVTPHGSLTGLGYSPFPNATDKSLPPHGSYPTLGIAILSFAFIVGFPGNAFVIWTILRCMKKCSVTCLLILHLAIADISVILTAPMFLHLLTSGSWTFGNIVCKMCHYISCLSMYASIILITSMSIDRFICVAKPTCSGTIRTRSIFGKIVLAIWVLACLLAIPMPIYRAVDTIYDKPQCIPIHSTPGHVIFQYIFETITGFIIPFAIISFCYLYIRVRLQSATFQTKHKTSRLVIMIIVIFALLWLPYHVVNIIQVSGEVLSSERLRAVSHSARPSVTALAFVSSSINPILYVFAGCSFIRSAGVEFMAQVFERAGYDLSNMRKNSQASRQKSQEDPLDLGNMIKKCEL